MTEYWVSKQSYYCKYCEIYIRDDKPSRAQHENGLRHKGNLERYIRDIYKKEERINYEKEEEKRLMKKINDAAQATHESQDQVSSSSKRLINDDDENESEETNLKKVKREEWKGAQNVMNYSDAKSLGFVNESDLERMNEEEEKAREKEIRMKEGLLGKWEISNPIPKPKPNSTSTNKSIVPNEAIKSKLSNQINSDLEPPSKLFSERKIETDFDPTRDLEIKVKRKTKVQLKEEEETQLNIKKPILPFRLDGIQSEVLIEETLSNPVNLNQMNSGLGEEDVKPDVNQTDDIKPLIEEETKVLFKKRKPKANSTLRQKS
ncbi:hypothetical protein DFH28DRAFT_318753 [Melampsora americana]|nr:hypothetical protein DFH28DRAFT_318753 [Melampsora americana]